MAIADILAEIAATYRTYVTDGLPASGFHDPDKPRIIGLLSDMAEVEQDFLSGILLGTYPARTTRALLYAYLTPAADTLGFVMNDADPTYNGVYTKVGGTGTGSWSYLRDFVLPASVLSDIADLKLRGAITVNAVGNLAGRGAYDDENDGFVYVDSSGVAPAAYILNSGVWGGPFAIQGQPGQTIVLDPTFATVALMNANLNYPAQTAARVIADPLGNVTNGNGYWIKAGASGTGSWSWIAPLTYLASILLFDDGSSIEDSDTDAAWSIEDTAGNQVARVQNNDIEFQWAGSSARFGRIAELDNRNIARALNVQSRPHNVRINPLTETYQGVLCYGQSLGVGVESWPALSTVAIPHTYMIGEAERGNGSSWVVVGTVQLNPLIGVVSSLDSPFLPLTPPEIAALVRPDVNPGESPLISMTRALARAWDNEGYRPTREWVAMNCAEGGKAWEELAPGYSPNWFNRLEDAIDHFDDLTFSSKSIAAVMLEGGQYNYRDDSGVTIGTDILASMLSIQTTLDTYISSVTGQDLPPAYFVVQPGGQNFVRDQGTPPNASASATLKFVDQVPHAWLVGPDYYVPDVGSHLTANGSRWIGEKAGQVARHVIERGLDWQPVKPINSTLIGTTLYIGFHAPSLPLQFKAPYELTNENDGLPNYGLRLTDDSGTLGFASLPTLAGASVIALELGRAINGPLWLWTGSWSGSARGMTMICDSDGTRANEVYEYIDPPMPASENLTDLVGKPYPMNNWCVIGRWAIGTTPLIETEIVA